MKQIVKIEISIEHEVQTGLRAECHITDMLFTEYDNLLSFDNIKENLTVALKMLKSFSMLTIEVYDYEDSFSLYNKKNIISGRRFLNKYNEITKANLQGNKFEHWNPSNKKEIFETLKDCVDTANKRYITLIKKVA